MPERSETEFYEMSREEITKEEFNVVYPKLLTEDQHEVLDYIFEGYLSQKQIAEEIYKKQKILSCLQDKMLEDVFRFEEKERKKLIKYSIEDAFKRALAIEKVFLIQKKSLFQALLKHTKLISRILNNDQNLIQEFLFKCEKSIEEILLLEINDRDLQTVYGGVRSRFASIYKKFYLKGEGQGQQINLLLQVFVNHREELFSSEAKNKLNLHAKDRDQFSNCEKINQEEYVKRNKIEEDIKQVFNLTQQKITALRIKGIKRVGKTCLLEQFIMPHVEQLGYCIVSLSLQLEMEGFTNNEQEFFDHLCTCIKDKLKTSLQLLPQYELPPEYIEENLQFNKTKGGRVAFQEFLGDMLRYTPDKIPILLAFDHVEYIFQFSDVAVGFGEILREIMDDRNNMFRNLFFVILYSTQNYAKLSIKTSQFDTIGVPYIIKDFDFDEVKELAKIAFPESNPWGEEQLRKLTELVGGYIYLLKRAFNDSKIQDPQTILAELNTQSSIYRSLFYEYLETLNENEDLKKDFKRVVDADHPVQLGCHSSFLLERMGLIKLEGNDASPRCKLYRDYFRQELQS